MTSLFVDGMGHIKTMDIDGNRPVVSFPVHSPMQVTIDDHPSAVSLKRADFERIGTLTDGPPVYVQCGFGLKLWVFNITVFNEAQYFCPIDIAEEGVHGWMRACAPPVLCLHRSQKPDESIQAVRHHFEGVGRERPTQ